MNKLKVATALSQEAGLCSGTLAKFDTVFPAVKNKEKFLGCAIGALLHQAGMDPKVIVNLDSELTVPTIDCEHEWGEYCDCEDVLDEESDEWAALELLDKEYNMDHGDVLDLINQNDSFDYGEDPQDRKSRIIDYVLNLPE